MLGFLLAISGKNNLPYSAKLFVIAISGKRVGKRKGWHYGQK